ncbi:MAG: type I restriction-modification system subunit M [bacterium]
MENKKELERQELHKTIWGIADDLRGHIDGWDFKNYVLGMLFYRYISENLAAFIEKNERESGNKDFKYSEIDDVMLNKDMKEYLINSKGFFILPSELFCNIQRSANDDPNLNENLGIIFKKIEDSAKGMKSEDSFKGLFKTIALNDDKLGGTLKARNNNLVKLMNGINKMNLGNYQDNTIDAFGDAYEYLMGMYAGNAGKSGGEYFTPQEVSELLAKLTVVGKTTVNKVYDPTVGSGSLLLKFAKILGKENVRNGFYGQESNITTFNLCRINMFLHDIDYDKFSIKHEDTLLNPAHLDDEPFEAIVSNPPYSTKWEGDNNPLLINDIRFSPAGVLAPKSNSDYAFIMHSLNHLAANGVAAIVCYPGILKRKGTEQKIREYLVKNNFIDCIIQLPVNLFFGTPISTCIMVLKKNKIENKTLFIDASNDYLKVTNNNKLTKENIDGILDSFIKRENKDFISSLVENDKIKEMKYDLSVNNYVIKENKKEEIDIKKVNEELEKIVTNANLLRKNIKNIIEEIEG